jgi:serine/threonine protein phosphatase PrpC
MSDFQWVLALTRVVSAVFRKGGDISFLPEELKQIFDPKGGYYKKGGVWVPSLVAEIGLVLEKHLSNIDLAKYNELDQHQKDYIASKIQELQDNGETITEDGFPDSAQLCSKCSTKALVLMDGCMTCLNCGDSKCG